MRKQALDALPPEIRLHPESLEINLTEAEAFLNDNFSDTDVFAFLGVPRENRDQYLDRSLDLLLELDRAGKVFAPEAYQEFLDEELQGMKVHYHSPESRAEEMENIKNEAGEIDNLIAPTMDYTVPRNYIEASKAFPELEAPEGNQLLEFADFPACDGELISYVRTDLKMLFSRFSEDDADFDYEINDTEVFFPGVRYSEEASDYFGKFFFSPKSEAVRRFMPQNVKDAPKKFVDFDY